MLHIWLIYFYCLRVFFFSFYASKKHHQILLIAHSKPARAKLVFSLFPSQHSESQGIKEKLLLKTHTLSNIILFLQPVRAELLFTPFQAIFLFFQPARAELLHTLSKNILTPFQTIFLFFQPARAELLHTLSNIILFLQPSRAEILFTPFQKIFYFPHQPGQSTFSHF